MTGTPPLTWKADLRVRRVGRQPKRLTESLVLRQRAKRSMLLRAVSLFLILTTAVATRAASYVEFDFDLPANGQNPFAREISADVKLPNGATLRAPAFFLGGQTYAVRVATDRAGRRELLRVVELQGGAWTELSAQPTSPRSVEITQPAPLPFVRLDPADRRRFVAEDGKTYFPIGTNLAWPDATGLDFYRRVLPQFHAGGLNWTRIWMAHWSHLNLDWLPDKLGPSPAPGMLDLEVAKTWDQLLTLAEDNGVYVQLVLQHHGQFATQVNPNWDINPWNVANPGGFLQKPTDFFTSRQARLLTRQKYRYIVARWGYSPAILAWELFNEVHHTDAIRFEESEPVVAEWHREMTAFLRSVDVHHHLVTTSLQEPESAVYSELDYVQPHLYGLNMLAAARSIFGLPSGFARAAFYGECGDDNQILTKAEYDSGVALVPPVWASLTGVSNQPAQIWYGDRLMDGGRLPELFALAKVVRETGYAEWRDTVPFSPAVEGAEGVPLIVSPGFVWAKHTPAVVPIPNDGREPMEYAEIPRYLVGKDTLLKQGYAGKIEFDLDCLRARPIRIRLANAGIRGAKLRVTIDDQVVALNDWPALVDPESKEKIDPELFPARPSEIVVDFPRGRHLLSLENVGGSDAVMFEAIDFAATRPIITAVGRRNASAILLWAWNRKGVMSLTPPAPSSGTVTLEDLSAGKWTIMWWDGSSGTELKRETIEHQGGSFRLPTPPISRHAVAWLKRES